jgi:hypothetical protein
MKLTGFFVGIPFVSRNRNHSEFPKLSEEYSFEAVTYYPEEKIREANSREQQQQQQGPQKQQRRQKKQGTSISRDARNSRQSARAKTSETTGNQQQVGR